MDPEGDPGEDDNEHRRDVRLEQVVAELPLQVKLHHQTRKRACKESIELPGWKKNAKLKKQKKKTKLDVARNSI